mmetsp:Transcript_22778/g.56204  ORF Transcript_22778/g.56204 Transcript_22778/m.56204 type:complete len:219 (+) Transcript_22778:707-1363(+)
MRRSFAAFPVSPSAPSTDRAVCSVTVGSAARATCSTCASGVTSLGSSCAKSWLKYPTLVPSPWAKAPLCSRSPPPRVRNSVDLPAPLGPTMSRRSPRRTVRSAPVMSGSNPPPYPTVAPVRMSASLAPSGGLGSFSDTRLESPGPAPRSPSPASATSSSSPSRIASSCFARLFAALAVDARALFLATNSSSLSAFATALAAAEDATFWRYTRSSRNLV